MADEGGPAHAAGDHYRRVHDHLRIGVDRLLRTGTNHQWEAEYRFDAVAIQRPMTREDVARNDETPDDHASGLRSAALGSGLAMFFSILFGSAFLEIMRVALLGAIITPLLSTRVTIRDDLLTRGRILGYLEANAGIHFSAIRDGLGLANGVTAYHLKLSRGGGYFVEGWKV